jgi:hypothetical protein
MAVILLGTLDTKGVEFEFVRDLLHQAGLRPSSSTPASSSRRGSRRTSRARKSSPPPAAA